MRKLVRALHLFSHAARASGRTIPALVGEMLRLNRSVGRIGINEYFDFQLYLNDLSHAQKCAFGGWRAQAALEEILVDEYARFLSLDKFTMYSLLASQGFPIPQLKAVYGSARPSAVKTLRSASELAAFLSAPQALPVYMKRSFGSYGRGNVLVRSLVGDRLALGDGTTMDFDQFAASLEPLHDLGWILQEPLQAHADIAALCGDKVSGVRVHTFLGARGPDVVKAIWKINVGKEDSDNFRHGASGNMLAAVDLVSGRVTRVVRGTGLQQQRDPVHPVTGRELLGFQIPYWQQIKEMVCEANLAFPGFICPGWDIAVCDEGPRILEVNMFGDIDLSQHACRQGFLDAPFVKLMDDRGLASLLTGPVKKRSRSKRNNRLGRRTHHWTW